MTKTIGIFVGSLRKGSYSRIIAQEMAKQFPAGYEAKFIEIGDLPLYNQDFDDLNEVPAQYPKFRDEVKAIDAALFVTPEYNRSVPAVLKNALDVASRPYGANVWDGKPAAVVSVSIGAISGFGANQHLRQALVFLNMPTLQQPEAYIGNVTNFIDEDKGEVNNRGTKDFLKSIDEAFVKLIDRY
ncbi:MAG: NAD(P)H-dependent oxidoreductase [Lactobacillus sp.]|nr:NAD(P)H-dependent oxidoreductase [Lactobacillus sp.]